MIPRTPFARIGLFCLQNNMVPDKWRDFMRKNRLMPQKEVALVSRYLKIGPCNPLSKAHPQINILAWCWYLGNKKFISIIFIENNFWDQGFIVLGKKLPTLLYSNIGIGIWDLGCCCPFPFCRWDFNGSKDGWRMVTLRGIIKNNPHIVGEIKMTGVKRGWCFELWHYVVSINIISHIVGEIMMGVTGVWGLMVTCGHSQLWAHARGKVFHCSVVGWLCSPLQVVGN